jgi:TnpA family transposase
VRIVGRSLHPRLLAENKSEVQPDTIHADTQGQSTAIFGLAYLLGIELMPRIRNWKDQHLFRAAPDVSYDHIDELFTAQVDWNLIATLVPDMMRVAVSIRTGNILPSDILRRLNSSSRKNKLYFGLRELGRVVRTIFLLRYLSDAELRRTIQAATNKSERFNQFVQWVSFGGDSVIAENTRDEQRKFIKYNMGSPPWRGREIPAGNPRGTGRAAAGGGKVRSSDETSNDRGAKGP